MSPPVCAYEDAMQDTHVEGQPTQRGPAGTKIALVAIGLSFVTPIIGLFFLFGTAPWIGALLAATAPVLGIAAIAIANRARHGAKRAGLPQWRAILAIVLASLTVLPSATLGGAVALVDAAATVVPRGARGGYRRPDTGPGWGWSHDGTGCGSYTCARIPSGREIVFGTLIVGALVGLYALTDGAADDTPGRSQ